ncbi:peptide chain release factor H [Pseudomonas sp. CNPSo 3701]|uniref:peptide chain release factor H n=1 Tax=Pseudomonas sp. CNPSo 3701 TaxID=3027943 RepID=UPI0023647760|nr:peptide chain release factor H [Pseudomonas sp. CNPSo 3701]MDD1507081.1 peptide chain release factor H [Pseudomonas sp. CNPSo 3701]
MILLQLSAAQGPDECALAVARALPRLKAEADGIGVTVRVLEDEPGPRRGTLRSVLLALDGEQAERLAGDWTGSLQWICPSPYRPGHARKKWFFGGAQFTAPSPELAGEIRFETLRSSGPGGQHVNTTDSAVRATHVASGISVKVQSERSQHANKRLALLLIAQRLALHAQAQADAARAQRRDAHLQVERGNPRRVFRGERFEPASDSA